MRKHGVIWFFIMVNQSSFARYLVPQDVDWNGMAQQRLHEVLSTERNNNVAKNVILFLGDGMSISTVTAARIYQGQLHNKSGEEGWLTFDKFPQVGLIKTYNVDYQVPDSAGTATAFLTGVKTKLGVTGVSDRVTAGDCSTQFGNEVDSVLHWSLAEGKSVGLVTTARVTHATPAAAYSHSVQRNWESDSDLPEDAKGRCEDIASQLIKNNKDIQVILGGGRRNFLPKETSDPEYKDKRGKRSDARNLIEEWMADKRQRNLHHAYVWNVTGFMQQDSNKVDYLLGLFEYGHMKYEHERLADKAGEPSLTDMAEMAIKILRRNPKGFFLLVEGGRIDHGHHDGAARKAVSETIAFSDAVQKAVTITSEDDTLTVVTADHSHTMTLGGYPSRGNSILGFAETEEATDRLPYTTLTYANGPGYSIDKTTGMRANLTNTDIGDFNYRQQSAVPIYTESHGGEDVATYAKGPMAHLFSGVQEQHYIAHAMAYASCVGQNKNHCHSDVIYDQITHNSAPVYFVERSFLILLLFITIHL